MPLDLAIEWFARLLVLSLIIQTCEERSLSYHNDVKDIFTWSIQKGDIGHTYKIIQRLFDFIFDEKIHHIHLILRLVALISLVITPLMSAALFIFLSTIILLIRWRGAFNGGSDFMTLVTVTGLVIGTCLSPILDQQAAWTVAFLYVSIHSATSYFMSGAVKLLNRHWRNGTALTHFLNGALYGPLSKRSPFQNPMVAAIASSGFILWEISFPVALFDFDIARLYCVIAFIFHLLVFRFFGLNRFVWAWAATFPALLYCAGRL